MSEGLFCKLRSFSSDVFERRMSTGSWLTALLSRDFKQDLRQIFSLRVTTLSNTNLVALRHIKRDRLKCVAQKRRCFNTLLCPNYRPFPHYAPVRKHKADLATGRERQLTKARANQTGLTNERAANWAPEVVLSSFRALSRRQLTFPSCC